MDVDQYQIETERTAKREWPAVDGATLELLNYALGCAGEGGEIADEVKKVVFHGHALDKARMVKELGDYFWYGARLAAWLGVPVSYVLQENVRKLRQRYPAGFSEQDSRNRTP